MQERNFYLWSLADGTCHFTFVGHDQDINFAAFSPDGTLLASASDDESVILWNVNDGTIAHTLIGHTYVVLRVIFSPDGRCVASVEDRTIRIWNCETGQQYRLLSGQHRWMEALCFSPDGKYLASGTWFDPEIILWDIEQGKVHQTLVADIGGIRQLAFLPHGEYLIANAGRYTLLLWHLPTGTVIKQDESHSTEVENFRFLPDGQKVVTKSEKHGISTISIRDDQTFKRLIPQSEKLQYYGPIDISHDGQYLISVDRNRGKYNLRCWRIADAQEIDPPISEDQEIRDPVFMPDDQVIGGASGTTIHFWSIQGMKQQTIEHKKRHISTWTYAPNGETIAVGTSTGHLCIYALPDGKIVKIFKNDWSGGNLRFSPDNRVLAAGGVENSIGLWDLETCHPRRLYGHTSWIESLDFSKDGQLLVSGGHDTTIRVWGVATLSEQSLLRGHTKPVGQVAFSPDGRLIASCSDDGTIRLWGIPPEADVAP